MVAVSAVRAQLGHGDPGRGRTVLRLVRRPDGRPAAPGDGLRGRPTPRWPTPAGTGSTIPTAIIRDNQAVDLCVVGLGRTRPDMLEYKAARYGRTFVRIGRFEPTSQVCCVCGVKDGPKPLHVRVWACGACGAVLDRDINAAVNVAKAAGLAVSA